MYRFLNNQVLTLERPRAGGSVPIPLDFFKTTFGSFKISQKCPYVSLSHSIPRLLVYLAWSWSHFTPGYTWKSGGTLNVPAGINYKYLYLSLHTRYKRNPNGYFHVFGVQKHNGSNAHIVQCNGKWKIKDGDHSLENDMHKFHRSLQTRYQRNSNGYIPPGFRGPGTQRVTRAYLQCTGGGK